MAACRQRSSSYTFVSCHLLTKLKAAAGHHEVSAALVHLMGGDGDGNLQAGGAIQGGMSGTK
jgi:hypothetical protein